MDTGLLVGRFGCPRRDVRTVCEELSEIAIRRRHDPHDGDREETRELSMSNRRPKASDISDDAFTSYLHSSDPISIWDLRDRLEFPEKVVLAKARSLIRRGVIGGCGCGCRGDFVLCNRS